MTKAAMENVQKLVLLLTDKAQDQGDMIIQILDVIADIADLMIASDAAAALLEARVQFLEANDGP